MKKSLLMLATLAVTASVFGQGQVIFNNRVTTGTLGNVLSPIFGPDPANPTLSKVGGTPTGNPSGTTTYGGPGLVGTGFSAALFFAAGDTGVTEGQLTAASVGGTTTFRTSGSGLLTQTTALLPGVTGGRATFQVRAWDNMGGTVTTWDAALLRQDVAKGKSNLFSPPFDVGFGTVQPPALQGLQSFNIAAVPEPSTIALGLLGGLGTLVLFRRRK
jgi:hypothetical protein